MDRRTTLKWMLAAAASVSALDWRRRASAAASRGDALPDTAKGYGTDPDVIRTYAAGDLWPLTFTDAQRRTARSLCDIIIPADERSPRASDVGVVEFIDEWVSAPYDEQRQDRALIIEGLAWMESESMRRFSREFAALDERQSSAICDDICSEARARPAFARPAAFFARFRDLTAGGFYTTPVGREDLQYVGNVPLATFDGPPLEVLRKVGLA